MDRLSFEKVLMVLPIGLLVIDVQCKILFANSRAIEVLKTKDVWVTGRDEAGLWYKGFDVRDLFGPDSSFNYVISRVLESGEVVRGLRMAFSYVTGAIPIEVYISRITRDSDYQVEGAVVMFDDITERLELERRIGETERLAAIGELAAGAAHEIRNPLTAVKGFAQLLGRHLIDDEPWSTYAGIIEREIGRIDNILKDLLMLSKPKKSSLEYVDLNKLAEEVLLLWGNQAAGQGTNIVLALERDVPWVVVDPAEIRQVLNNLVSNALDATQNGGVIEIGTRWRLSERMVEVFVKDMGNGINTASLAKIFNPFFTTKERGTGLGLSVAYSIVQSYGGMIEVESTTGKGTTFQVLLPVPMACLITANSRGVK